MEKEQLIKLLHTYVETYGELPQYPGKPKSKWSASNGYTGIKLILKHFSSDISSTDGLATKCKLCCSNYQKEHSYIYSNAKARRRSQIISTISNIEIQKIKEFYKNCPPGHHVDHIVPLSKGGTHTLDNLQYLTAYENLSKGDKIL